jgi:hypothetical protein
MVELRGLTFELTGRQRRAALARTERMYRVPQSGPRWPAVGAPVERGVRRHAGRLGAFILLVVAGSIQSCRDAFQTQ